MSTRSKEHRERVAAKNAEYERKLQYDLGIEMAKGMPEPAQPEAISNPEAINRKRRHRVIDAHIGLAVASALARRL